MIEKMTKYSFILLSGKTEEFLRRLQELGLVDITRSSKPVDERSAALLSMTNELKKTASKLESLDYSQDPDLEKSRPRSMRTPSTTTLWRVSRNIPQSWTS